MSPTPATMVNTPKAFSPVRRTDWSYPRTKQLRGRLPPIGFPQHPDQNRPELGARRFIPKSVIVSDNIYTCFRPKDRGPASPERGPRLVWSGLDAEPGAS
jgi:hypothetical protein